MSAEIIDGKALAQEVRFFLKQEIEKNGYTPKLAIILVGDNAASRLYIKGKQKAAAEVGICADIYEKDEQTSQEELLSLIDKLNADETVNGIIVQLPLPRHINAEDITGRIAEQKDVDGFGPMQKWLLENDEKNALASATPKGVIKMIESIGKSFVSRNALVIGRSHIVGRPMATMLLNRDCTVTVAHSRTKNLDELCKNADILVAACGCPKLVKKDWIKEGAIVIDVGINHIDGKLCGDVDFENALDVAGWISPVPGGVGPMTIAMLLDNTVLAYKKQKNLS